MATITITSLTKMSALAPAAALQAPPEVREIALDAHAPNAAPG